MAVGLGADDGRAGRTTSANDDDSYAPLRPQRTGQSLQERTRRTQSTPYADFGVTIEKLQFEVSSSRGADIHRVTTSSEESGGQAGGSFLSPILSFLNAQGTRSAASATYTFLDEYLWTEPGRWIKGYVTPQLRGNAMEIIVGNPLDRYEGGLETMWNVLKTGIAKGRKAAKYADYFEKATEPGARDLIGQIKTTAEDFAENPTEAIHALDTYVVNPVRRGMKAWQPQSLASDTIREVTLVVPTGKGKQALEEFEEARKAVWKDPALKYGAEDLRPNIQEGIPGRAGKLLKGLGYAGAAYSLYNLHGELERGEYYESTVDVANVLSVAVAATPVGRLSSAYALGSAAGSGINFVIQHTPLKTPNDYVWDRIYDFSRLFVRST